MKSRSHLSLIVLILSFYLELAFLITARAITFLLVPQAFPSSFLELTKT